MSRFYVQPDCISKDTIFVSGNEAHHILDVMRLVEGDTVVVFDGTGAEYSGFIKASDRKNMTLMVEIVKTRRPPADKMPDITLAQAIPKKDKMDLIVEKSTELGVARIIPFISDRTIVRPDKESADKKIERWSKLAVAAAKQCGRVSVPGINPIVTYESVLKCFRDFDLCLFAWLAPGTVPIKEAISGLKAGKILLLIGPEGDFTPDEVKLAHGENSRFISLGSLVLKSDTAGLYALSVLNYEFSSRASGEGLSHR